MTDTVSDLLERLRRSCARPGEVVDSDPGPARTRGTTTEAGWQHSAQHSGTRRCPAPLPAPRRALVGRAHDHLAGYPAVVWRAADVPERVEAAIRQAGSAALLADEGDNDPPCTPCDERPPLWVLRKPNGMPNYANAAEMERYLRESGWLTWSSNGGGRYTPPDDAWERWVAEQNDPRRVPPAAKVPHALDGTPEDRLAEATVDEPERLDVDHEHEGGELVAA